MKCLRVLALLYLLDFLRTPLTILANLAIEYSLLSLRVLTCCWILVDVGAILKIQTYCTGLTDNLSLNELLNLSRKCAVVRDHVASIRIHNCNMALTVNFACPVDICFLALESNSIPIFSCSLHAQAATVGDEFT